MVDPTNYDPRYVSLDHIPIEIEDSYTTDQKRTALFQAESTLEIDRNGGDRISDDDITNTHISAVQNLATYHLTRGATSNQDVTLGDLDDGGEQTERHAEQYKETYEELIEKLSEAGGSGQSGTFFGAAGGSGRSIAVNSGDDSRRHRLGGETADPVHSDYVRDTE